ncbi:hypothetical protein [[Phormidium] sp. ETS-05]|uniref:hypothetical protein n=1 Tax=[Phormidium] sp. ETS-05 TaxID=222819 RepID=UPI0018EEDB38|nr:hypothetical protein [[Phormidium] sp. ETS-05]
MPELDLFSIDLYPDRFEDATGINFTYFGGYGKMLAMDTWLQLAPQTATGFDRPAASSRNGIGLCETWFSEMTPPL